MSEPIIPFKAPRAPESEPEAVLKFGDVEVRLTWAEVDQRSR